MKKHVTICSVFLGIAFSLAALGSCSSGSGGGDNEGPIYTVDARTVEGVSFNMHSVPSGGTFIMGEHVATTTQTVTLTRNFWMGETEVTQGLWEAIWGDTWPGSPGSVPDDLHGLGVSNPAYYVSWFDMVAFCNLLTVADGNIADTERVYYSDAGFTTAYTAPDAASHAPVYVNWSRKGYRLPTEAEWEYAARYVDGTSWNRGDHVSGGPVYTDETDPDKISDYAWIEQVSNPRGSKEVGQKLPNALGLRDMSGNVWESCYDWYADYGGTVVNDPTGPASGGSDRVVRGGGWDEISLNVLCCATRLSVDPAGRWAGLGFRLCRSAD
jgi:formylglycine-generating enzyme required for sulfatase activity